MTALLRVTNGQLLVNPSARELMGALAMEAAQVASVENIPLPFLDAVAAVEDVAQKTAQNHSSMLQDVLRNAPTEIDAINGAVVQAAQRHDLEAPVNWTCWKLVKALAP
ncbi:MAG: ketopantoate reductase C-terminal domain-containing protein [Anaerolineales bacterium]